MIIAIAIIVGICSIFVIVSPLIHLKPKTKYNLRFWANVLMCSSLVTLMDEIWDISRWYQFLILIGYIIVVFGLAKIIEAQLPKS